MNLLINSSKYGLSYHIVTQINENLYGNVQSKDIEKKCSYIITDIFKQKVTNQFNGR